MSIWEINKMQQLSYFIQDLESHFIGEEALFGEPKPLEIYK